MLTEHDDRKARMMGSIVAALEDSGTSTEDAITFVSRIYQIDSEGGSAADQQERTRFFERAREHAGDFIARIWKLKANKHKR